MAITRVKLENFTVFDSLDLEPSPGINVLVGANGTGKTHLMKVCYAVPSPSQRILLLASWRMYFFQLEIQEVYQSEQRPVRIWASSGNVLSLEIEPISEGTSFAPSESFRNWQTIRWSTSISQPKIC